MASTVVFGHLRPKVVPRPQHHLPGRPARRCLARSIEAGRTRARAAPLSREHGAAGAMAVLPGPMPLLGGARLPNGTPPRRRPSRHG